jgi:hypothetical protein
MAGFETTAGTMSFALPYMALYPEFQDWVIEEVDKHFTGQQGAGYYETYPKLSAAISVNYSPRIDDLHLTGENEVGRLWRGGMRFIYLDAILNTRYRDGYAELQVSIGCVLLASLERPQSFHWRVSCKALSSAPDAHVISARQRWTFHLRVDLTRSHGQVWRTFLPKVLTNTQRTRN